MTTPFHITGEAEAILPARDNKGKPITVIGTEAIHSSFDVYHRVTSFNPEAP
jgi:tRNA-splicing ligase RtcB